MNYPAEQGRPKPRRLLQFAIGLVAALGANGCALLVGDLSCGSAAGEIPPWAIFLMLFWAIQWSYLVPAMIVVAIMRRWWALLGILTAGLLTGLASILFFLLIASNPSTV